MLAPEVWHIKTEETSKNEYKSEFKYYKTDNIDHLIGSHYFNHSVAFTFAGSTQISSEMINILETDNDYYIIHNVTISEFYTPLFIESFVKKGDLTALSINDDIHSTNSFAVLPNGHLILRVLEDTYSCLGIDGKCTKNWGTNHYVINLDLNKNEQSSGKLHDRYHKCLTDSDLRFDVLISWEPSNPAVCPSSVASYFHKKLYKISLCTPQHTLYEKFEETVPNPVSSDPEEFLHWFGVHLLDANDETKKVKQSQSKSNIITHRWTGFLTAKRALNLWKHMKKEKENLKSNESWISLYISGFQNSPVTFGFSSDISVKNSDDFFTIFCTHDSCIVYPPKCIKIP